MLIAVSATASAERPPLGTGRAKLVLEGFAAGRERLRSGHCLISGRLLNRSGAAATAAETETEKEQYFDLDALLFRVRHEETRRDPAGAGASAFSWGRTTIATPDFVCSRPTDDALISVGPATKEMADYQDPRTIGLAGLEELQRPVDLPAMLERWRRLLADDSAAAYPGPEPGQVELVLRSDFENAVDTRLSAVFDETRDFVPIAYEQRVRLRKKGAAWSPPVRSGVTTWTEVAGVYVPATAQLTLNVLAPGQDEITQHLELSLTFEWKSVNQPIDRRLFTVESLDAGPGRAVIFDDRSGRRVMTQHPNVIDPRRLAQVVAAQDDEMGLDVSRPGGRVSRVRVWLLVGINALAALALSAYVLYRRFGRRRAR